MIKKDRRGSERDKSGRAGGREDSAELRYLKRDGDGILLISERISERTWPGCRGGPQMKCGKRCLGIRADEHGRSRNSQHTPTENVSSCVVSRIDTHQETVQSPALRVYKNRNNIGHRQNRDMLSSVSYKLTNYQRINGNIAGTCAGGELAWADQQTTEN